MLVVATVIFLLLLGIWILFIHKWLARTVFSRASSNPGRLRILSALSFVLVLLLAWLVAGVSLLSYITAFLQTGAQ